MCRVESVLCVIPNVRQDSAREPPQDANSVIYSITYQDSNVSLVFHSVVCVQETLYAVSV
jgi:hypothetical protein